MGTSRPARTWRSALYSCLQLFLSRTSRSENFKCQLFEHLILFCITACLSVGCYNLLSKELALRGRRFHKNVHVPNPLQWQSRRALLLTEIESKNTHLAVAVTADIIVTMGSVLTRCSSSLLFTVALEVDVLCVQELDASDHSGEFGISMGRLGYKSVFQKRHADHAHGFAIFFKKDRLVRIHHVHHPPGKCYLCPIIPLIMT